MYKKLQSITLSNHIYYKSEDISRGDWPGFVDFVLYDC